jgi:MFS transporter, DHA2 family, multidrug resistance protein
VKIVLVPGQPTVGRLQPGLSVTAEVSTSSVNRSSVQSSTNPYIGIAGVFLGAGLAALSGRLVSVGLPDLRGAFGFGFDEASWLPTALNMATMFAGCFVVFLSAIYGIRRILLRAAGIFALTSVPLPSAPA